MATISLHDIMEYIKNVELTMIASFGFDLRTKHGRQPQWREPPEKGLLIVVWVHFKMWCNGFKNYQTFTHSYKKTFIILLKNKVVKNCFFFYLWKTKPNMILFRSTGSSLECSCTFLRKSLVDESQRFGTWEGRKKKSILLMQRHKHNV